MPGLALHEAYRVSTITSIESTRCAFTANMRPRTAFSGCGPNGLIARASRKVPVHSLGSGSSFSLLCLAHVTGRSGGGDPRVWH